jgi:small-conductance mechanosensitive channel
VSLLLFQTPSNICEDDGPFCEAVYDFTGSELLAQIATWLIAKPLVVLLIFAVAMFTNRLIGWLIKRSAKKMGAAASHQSTFVSQQASERAEQRAGSMSTLLRSATSAVVYATATLASLNVLGVSLVPVIASAGIAGVALGFGAQRVVEDVITGILMLLEDQFGVGDRIDVGMVDGTVEQVTVRSTVLRDPDGTLWHIPNSEIRRVANESQLWSRANVDIGIAYGASLKVALSALQNAADELTKHPDWADAIVGEARVLGIQELGADSINMRVVTRVEPASRRGYERELRRCLVEALTEADVEMPNRQVDIWMRS